MRETKLISDLYDQEANLGLGKVDLLACFALFDDDPDEINTLVEDFNKLMPADLQAARQSSTCSHRTRTILEITVVPKTAAAAAPGGR